MPPASIQLPPELHARLGRFAVRQRLTVVAIVFCKAFAGIGLWLLSIGFIDRFAGLPTLLRVCSLAVLVCLVIALLLQPLRRLLRPHTNLVEVAEQAERANPRFVGILSAVVTARQHPGASSMLVAELIRRAEAMLSGNAPLAQSKYLVAALRRSLLTVVLAGCTLGVALRWPTLHFGQLVRRQVAPLADIPPVRTTQIEVLTEDNVAVGQGVTIVARVLPAPKSGAMLRTIRDGRSSPLVGMTPGANDTFVHRLEVVSSDLQYEVAAGDSKTGLRWIRAVAVPPTQTPVEASAASRAAQAGALLRIQEVLAELPQHLSRIEQSAQSSRQALERADTTHRDAVQASGTRGAIAQRMAVAAQQQANESIDWLLETAQSLPVEQLAAVDAEISRLATAGVLSSGSELPSALASLQESLSARDPDGAARAASGALKATARLQELLRVTQHRLDPLDANSRRTALEPEVEAYFEAMKALHVATQPQQAQ